MLSPQARQDKLVRATDLDALSCRFSASNKGYFNPPDVYIGDLLKSYDQNLQYCEGYTQLSAGRTLRSAFKEGKFPLINRGTYFRTEAINRVVNEFIAGYSPCQIISLGGGSDTRCFRVLEKANNVTYTEIDFPESAKIKKIAISQNRQLQSIVHSQLDPLSAKSKDELASMDSDLHTDNYHLIGLDLRSLLAGDDKFAFLDTAVPTLVISECVLCYLTPEENEKVLRYWKESFLRVSLLIYEPMSLNDAFGQTMAQNLLSRGIDLQTFVKFPDLKSRRDFFAETLGLDVKLADMALVGGYAAPSRTWIPKDELFRVSRLEMIDEIEEIRLLLQHYSLIYAESGGILDSVVLLNWDL